MAATRAIAACEKARVAHTVHEYEHDPRAESYGLEAADAMGVDPARVFKTLLALADDRLVVALVPVDLMLDLKAVARAAGAKRAVMAPAAQAERATGYVVGGISPLGQTKRLPTFVDDSAAALATMFVSAGRRGLEVELAPADLLAITGATFTPLARRP